MEHVDGLVDVFTDEVRSGTGTNGRKVLPRTGGVHLLTILTPGTKCTLGGLDLGTGVSRFRSGEMSDTGSPRVSHQTSHNDP